jgi:two-component system cell cycle sensor histidine kinase/response regulator CckA
MSKPIRVLHIEDSEADTLLLDRHLAAADYDVTSQRVDTRHAMKAALTSDAWQIVLCDYTMPKLDAMMAHRVLRESGRDIPFIIVSGTVEEGTAVEVLLDGAHDFIPKKDLTRLIPAIERELHEAENRRERRAAEEALRLSEGRYRELFESAPDGIILASPDSYYLDANPGMCKMLGYTHSELIGMHATDIVAASETKDLDDALAEVMTATEYRDEWRFKRKDGSKFAGEVIARILPDGNLLAMVRDVSERHEAEEKLKRSETQLNQAQSLTHVGSWSWDLEANTLFWSDEHYRIYGLRPGQVEPSYEIVLGSAIHGGRDLLNSSVERSLLTHEPFDVHFQILRPDGAERTINSQASVDTDAHGKPTRMYGTVQDVTERKQAEDALRRAEEKYRSIFENSSEGIFQNTPEGRLISANPALARIFGYSSPQEMTREHTDIGSQGYADPALREKFKRDLEKFGFINNFQYEIRRRDGTSAWVSENTRIIHDETGLASYYEGSMQDITANREAAKALRQSEERYRDLVENAIDIIYTHDLEGNYTSVNKAGERITGYTHEESLKMNLAQVIAPESREKAMRMAAAKMTGEDVLPYDLEIIAKDGHRVAVEINTRLLFENGAAVGVQGIARDITERNMSEAALRESEAGFKSLFDTANDAIMVLSNGVFLDCNRRAEEMFGRPKPDIIGRSPMDLSPLIQPDGRKTSQRVPLYLGPALQGVPQFFEWQHLRSDGTLFDAEVSLNRVERGASTYLQAIVRDVTERKRAEGKLRSSEEDLSRSQRIAHLGSWELDLPEAGSVNDGRLRWSDEVFRIFGYQPHETEVTNDIFFKAVHPDDRELVADAIAAALREGTDYQIDHRILHPNGTERIVHEHAEVVRDADGHPMRMVGTIQDITIQKQLSEELRQSQKMEAIGVLAGGIAHDFNNLLTAINGYSDLTLKKMAEDDPLRGNIKEVREAGHRAAELTGQLLAFSRKQLLKSVVINLNTIVSNIENMLRRIIRESIDLRTVLDPELGNVKADPGQIEQVIMNLSINARDAMRKSGTLTIRTQNVYLNHEFASHHLSLAPGDYIKLTVTDTGEGMDPETRSHIFDPFFTTKQVGKGTGLGLSTVYGIVKQSGGDITVYSEPGHGTTFKIYLPCVDEVVEKPRWRLEGGLKYRGTETILLAEDEKVVRTLVCEILTGSGYKVLEAESGAAALSICRTYKGPIDLLLTDVIMPKMGGSELSDSVLELLPNTKVLFMSGYTDDSIAELGVLRSDTSFIEKPFTPDALCRKVREVLEYAPVLAI